MTAADVNHWFDDRCARAFWDQRQALPYQELLRDTAAYLDPRPGERWLDLGCGGGQLTALLWALSEGKVGGVVSVDCAAANAEAIAKLSAKMRPAPRPGQIAFRVGDISRGLGDFETASFDGIVSGLAISYAESQDESGRYTDAAYNRLLGELFRVLKPGGRLVFSVNVPEPRFWRIFWKSLGRGFRVSHAGRTLVNAVRMQRYGRWLKREARRGRFHFFPAEEIVRRLGAAGFRGVAVRLSYAEQAYVVRAEKRAEAAAGAA